MNWETSCIVLAGPLGNLSKWFPDVAQGAGLSSRAFHITISIVSAFCTSSFPLDWKKRASLLMEKRYGLKGSKLPVLFDIFVVCWPNPSTWGGQTPSAPQRLVWQQEIRSVCITNTNEREGNPRAFKTEDCRENSLNYLLLWKQLGNKFVGNTECRLYNLLKRPSRLNHNER